MARLLKEWGWEVEVFLYGDASSLPADARVNYERWLALGEVNRLANTDYMRKMSLPDLIVDAVFGTGLSREVQGHLSLVLGSLDSLADLRGVKIVSIDVASGMCSDSGKNMGTFCRADLTVTFHKQKLGHYLERGAMQSGKLITCEISLNDKKTKLLLLLKL